MVTIQIKTRMQISLIIIVLLAVGIGFSGVAPVQAGPDPQGNRTIACGAVEYGSLTGGLYSETFEFNGQLGQQVTIMMATSSGDLDPFLRFRTPDNSTYWEDDDSGGNRDARLSIILPTSGTYIIQASRYGFNEGTTSGDFSLNVTCTASTQPQAGGDVQAVPGGGGGGPILCGDTVTGTVSDSNPSDRWTFAGGANETLSVSMIATSGDLNPHVRVLFADDSVLDGDDDSGGNLNALLYATLPATGTYTIQAGRNALAGSNSGTYSLTLTCQVAPANPGNANPPVNAQVHLSTAMCGTRTVDSIDDNATWDRWTFNAVGGETLIITQRQETGNLDPYLTVVTPDGTFLTDDDSGGGTSGLDAQVVIQSAQAGSYSFEPGRVSGAGEYEFRLECQAVGAPPVAPPAAGGVGLILPIGCDLPAGSTINDQTWYDEWHFRTPGSQTTVTISMSAVSGNLDTYFDILDPAGNWIGDDNDSGTGTNSLLTFTFPAHDWYTIRATRAGGENGTTSGEYQLILNCQGAAQPPAQPPAGSGVGLQESILCNRTVGSTITDQMWYDEWYYSAQANETVTVAMSAVSGNLDTHFDIVDGFGVWVAADNDSGPGTNSLLTYTFPTQGWYTIRAGRAGGQNGLTSGGYELTFTCQSAAQPPANPGGQADSGPVIFPGPGFPGWVVDQGVVFCMDTVNWGLDSNAWYHEWQFEGVATQQVSIDMARTSGDLDSYLVVIFPDGSWMEDDDSGGDQNARVDFIVPVTGSYRIQTTRYGRQQGPTSGNFNLSLNCLSGGAPPSNAAQPAGANPPAQPGGAPIPITGAAIDRWNEHIEPWPTRDLTFYLENAGDITEVLMATEEALAFWLGNTTFTFTFVDNPDQADIIIKQPVTTIPADVLSAPYTISITNRTWPQVAIEIAARPEIGFDADDYNMAYILMHAIGHALGLEHSEFGDALMFPVMDQSGGGFGFAADDVDQLVTLYGPQVLPAPAGYAASAFAQRPFTVLAGETLTATVPYPNGVMSAGGGTALSALCAVEQVAPDPNAALSWKCAWTWDDTNRQAVFTIAVTPTGQAGGGSIAGRAVLVNAQEYRLVDVQNVTVSNGQTQQVTLNAPPNGTLVVETVTAFYPAGMSTFGYSITPSATGYAIAAANGNANSTVNATLMAFQPVRGSYTSALLIMDAATDELLNPTPVSANLEIVYFSTLTTYLPGSAADYGITSQTRLQALSTGQFDLCSAQNPQAANGLCVNTLASTTGGNAQSYAEVSTYLFQLQ